MAKMLMIQGCSSNAGKSLLVAGFCYYLRKRNIRVSPFKPQNMSLNSVVSKNGQEMARAQFVQALACGAEPCSDMSPILLKPQSNHCSELIVQGRSVDQVDAKRWRSERQSWLPFVLESFERVQSACDVVLIEGAGSPAEINLRKGDIANMGFAQLVNSPVILVGNIDFGGVFAHLYGTFLLLSKLDQSLIKGFLINCFRGDVSLLKSGLKQIACETERPFLGVLPYLKDLYFDAEDSLSFLNKKNPRRSNFIIAIIRYPKMSNANDFEPFLNHPDIGVYWLSHASDYEGADLLILPGSKSVIDDLFWLKEKGFSNVIAKHLRHFGRLFGICGGFQMLGKSLDNQTGNEGQIGVYEGLGLIDMQTQFTNEKKLEKRTVRLCGNDGILKGYEMHTGRSFGQVLLHAPMFEFVDRASKEFDGYISDDQLVFGTYLHGLFDEGFSAKLLLNLFGFKNHFFLESADVLRERSFEKLANAIDEYVDVNAIISMIETSRAYKG